MQFGTHTKTWFADCVIHLGEDKNDPEKTILMIDKSRKQGLKGKCYKLELVGNAEKGERLQWYGEEMKSTEQSDAQKIRDEKIIVQAKIDNPDMSQDQLVEYLKSEEVGFNINQSKISRTLKNFINSGEIIKDENDNYQWADTDEISG